MEYVYAFDALKKHTLTFQFAIDQYLEKANGVIDMYCRGTVIEKKDGRILHKESKSRTFSFKNKSDKQKQHDFNVSRIRYTPDKKWILSVSNNESIEEVLEVGIISDTANKNPLFVDIYSKDTVYSYYVKGNNLGILEANYKAPILEQTVVDYTFDQPGIPDGFVVDSSTFNSDIRAIQTEGFNYMFPSAIPENTSFTIQMNVLPVDLTGSIDGSIFTIVAKGIGAFTIYPTKMSFLGEGFPESSAIYKTFATPITDLTQLYDKVFKRESKAQIIGDGLGNLTLVFNNNSILTTYEPNQEFQHTSLVGGIISTSVDDEGNTIEERIKQNVDNISVTFKK